MKPHLHLCVTRDPLPCHVAHYLFFFVPSRVCGRFKPMQTGPLLTAALALLISSAPLSSAAEILSQQIELNSSSSVSPANGGFGSGDQDNRGNQGVGNRSLETSTQTIF